MKKIFLSFILFAGFLLTGFSQSNFIEGSITIPDGTVVPGLIDYQEWAVNPGKINFKTNKKSTIQVFNAEQIKSFYIKSKKENYRSAFVELNKETVDKSKLLEFKDLNEAATYARNFSTVKKNVFLITLVEGSINLYSFIDVDNVNQYKQYFFIQKNTDTLVQLKNLITLIKDEVSKNKYYYN